MQYHPKDDLCIPFPTYSCILSSFLVDLILVMKSKSQDSLYSQVSLRGFLPPLTSAYHYVVPLEIWAGWLSGKLMSRRAT